MTRRSADARWRRWLYRGGRPNWLASALNRVWATTVSAGLGARRSATVEVRGRTTGRVVSFPVVLADHEGHDHLVSMLGERASWVANVRAARGRVALRRGRRHEVLLHEVPVAERAPILRRYVQVAPGGRPHVGLDPDADLTEFERVAADFPVFRVGHAITP